MGYNRRFTLGSVYDSPCTVKEKPIAYFANTYVNMTGSGDASQCRQHVESLFQFTGCPYSRCSFDNISQPSVEGDFIVSNGVCLEFKGLELMASGGRSSESSPSSPVRLTVEKGGPSAGNLSRCTEEGTETEVVCMAK